MHNFISTWIVSSLFFFLISPSLTIAETPLIARSFPQTAPLQGYAITFQPDSPTSYSVCIQTGVTEFSHDPTTDNTLQLSDDDSQEITFDSSFVFPFFGANFQSTFVGSNGFLTFNVSDISFIPNISTMAVRPRIALAFTDLAPNRSGAVRYHVGSNQVVVTYDHVAVVGSNDTITAQVILEQDGSIQFTFLSNIPNRCIVGISNGDGVPSGFIPIDYANQSECVAVDSPPDVWLLF